MELILSGFTIFFLIILFSIFLLSFIDRDAKKLTKKSQNAKSTTKIMTQDGMVAKKHSKGPLLLIGDSKPI
jgi:preprotein translocase subunit YajC